MFLLGAGGHAKVIIEALELLNQPIEGIYDDSKTGSFLGVPILGKINEIPQSSAAVCCIGNNSIRQRISKMKLKWMTVIHPLAIVSKRTIINEGTVILAGVIINPDVIIDKHCIINTGAIIEHDCVINSYSHIAPRVCLTGGVVIGKGCLIGAGSNIIPGIKIGNYSIIGSGSNITRDILPYSKVVGINRIIPTKIGVVTTTRADYGLLQPIIKALDGANYDLTIFATGTHFSDLYGRSGDLIEAKSIWKCEMKCLDNHISRCSDLSKLMIEFGTYLANRQPEWIIILGDRFELMGICQLSILNKVKIIHLCGGDITTGAIDNKIRHSISQLADWHLTSCQESIDKLNQSGITQNIILAGNPGLWDFPNQFIDIYQKYNLPYKPGIVIVYHPVTNHPEQNNLDWLISFLSSKSEFNLYILGTNMDPGSDLISSQLKALRGYYFPNLHRLDYLSLIYHSKLVIGNSSSLIYEVPIIQRPALLIGDRQTGRKFSNGILKCTPENINQVFERALEMDTTQIQQVYPKCKIAKIINKLLINY